MAAATITEISYADLPMTLQSGTGTRLALVHLRCPAGCTSSTVNFSTYIPGCVDIVNVVGETDGNAVEGTASTWSTYTLTISSGAAGAYEGTFIVRTTV
jgi:hypothetical protein